MINDHHEVWKVVGLDENNDNVNCRLTEICSENCNTVFRNHHGDYKNCNLL